MKIKSLVDRFVPKASQEKKAERLPSWGDFLMITFGAVFAYTFMEWLFLVTMPSFMDMMSSLEKAEILLFNASLLTVTVYIIAVPLMVISILPWFKKYQAFLIKLSYIFPAIILAILALLWLDNFTYTVFKFGIVSTQGILRGVYAGIFILLIALFFRSIVRFLDKPPKLLTNARLRKVVFTLIGGILLLSVGILWMRSSASNQKLGIANNGEATERPNILLITGDGINATHMSVYGYERDTTPRLRELAETSLLAENNFTNAARTYNSILSIYTGRYPITTQTAAPVPVLREIDAYQHLPGILKLLGYRCVQIAVPKHVDAYSWNVLDGFAVANGRTLATNSVIPFVANYIPGDLAYFLSEISTRLLDRLGHIFYLKTMINPYDLVTQPAKEFAEQEKLEQLAREFRRAEGPLFVHIHLMGTHGALFRPEKRVFSTPETKDVQWDPDGYDDAILEFDQYMGKIFDTLGRRGMLNKTIVIVGSDHGQNFVANVRIPMLIHFPNDQYAGKITTNVQNLDIAPTVLDYLGVDKPEWMQGHSLLQELPNPRPIYASWPFIFAQPKMGIHKLGSGSMVLLYCQKWYMLNLVSLKMETGDIAGYVAPCPTESLLSEEQASTMLKEFTQTHGFDISTRTYTQTP